MRYLDLFPSRFWFGIGIPALALGQGLTEAGFIFAARLGLTRGGYAVFGWLSILALLRFVFQDRIAVLETRAMREAVSGLRIRVLDALRSHAIPAYRPDFKRALGRTLDETLPRVGEGFLANQRCRAALLQGLVLIPCLFLLSWQLALMSLALALPAWWAVRWRSRSLRALERSETRGRREGKRILADFGEGLESLAGNELREASKTLTADLEKTQESEWRWRLAQARYPALLEAGFFFALSGLVVVGGSSLGSWDGWILFSGLLLLAYRPVREAARHYPVSLQGTQALNDSDLLLREWKSLPLRTPMSTHSRNSLALQSVDFSYGSGRRVFQNFSAEFPADAVTGITGPNGAGKTTLLRLLAGVEIPSGGKVLWPETLRQNGTRNDVISYLPQRISLGSNWTLWEKSLRAENPKLWEELNELLGLKRLIEKAAHSDALSGGERQRMALGRALASPAPFLLLDEPTTALPGDERERILEDLLSLWARPIGRNGSRRGAMIVSHEPFLGKICHAMFALNANSTVLLMEREEPVRQ